MADKANPRGRGRPRAQDADQRRQRILDETAALFLEHGYHGVTMSMIAAAARVSLNTVYRLFPGKPDLFAAITGVHRRSMVALPGDYDDLPIAEALERIFFVTLDAEAEQKRFRLAQMLIAEAERAPELAELFHGEGPAETHRLLVDWLERQRGRGRIDFESGASTAKMLMDIAFGPPGLLRGRMSLRPDAEERAAHLKASFAIVARGLRRY